MLGTPAQRAGDAPQRTKANLAALPFVEIPLVHWQHTGGRVNVQDCVAGIPSEEPAHLRRVGDQIDRAASRVAMALMVAALIVGSSIVMTVSGGPTLFGLPAIGFIGFIGFLRRRAWRPVARALDPPRRAPRRRPGPGLIRGPHIRTPRAP